VRACAWSSGVRGGWCRVSRWKKREKNLFFFVFFFGRCGGYSQRPWPSCTPWVVRRLTVQPESVPFSRWKKMKEKKHTFFFSVVVGPVSMPVAFVHSLGNTWFARSAGEQSCRSNKFFFWVGMRLTWSAFARVLGVPAWRKDL
jgi:hypothetical protein